METDLQIEARSLTLGFGPPLITGLDLQLRKCARIGLTGRSGLGKTVFVEAIVQTAIGERSPSVREGQITVTTTPIGYSSQRVGVPRWFQVGALLERLIGRAPRDRRADLAQMRQRLGLDALKESYPRTLSGGEVQRLSLVMALSLAGDLLILDEPLTALDLATKTELMDAMLPFLERHKIGLLVVSHDLDLLIGLAQDIHVLGKTGIAATVTVSNGEEGQPDLASETATGLRAELLALLLGQLSTQGSPDS